MLCVRKYILAVCSVPLDQERVIHGVARKHDRLCNKNEICTVIYIYLSMLYFLQLVYMLQCCRIDLSIECHEAVSVVLDDKVMIVNHDSQGVANDEAGPYCQVPQLVAKLGLNFL